MYMENAPVYHCGSLHADISSVSSHNARADGDQSIVIFDPSITQYIDEDGWPEPTPELTPDHKSGTARVTDKMTPDQVEPASGPYRLCCCR